MKIWCDTEIVMRPLNFVFDGKSMTLLWCGEWSHLTTPFLQSITIECVVLSRSHGMLDLIFDCLLVLLFVFFYNCIELYIQIHASATVARGLRTADCAIIVSSDSITIVSANSA
jgi:hypothetical protein